MIPDKRTVRQAGRWQARLGCISETISCRNSYFIRILGRRCRCVMSWSDLDLTFDLALVTFGLKILSGISQNRKV